MTALPQIANGDTIDLPAGDYGRVTISGKTGVTIRSADPSDPARFTTITAIGCTDLDLDRLSILGSDGTSMNATLRLTNCVRVTAQNSGVTAAVIGAGSIGYPVYAINCDDLRLIDNQVRGGVRAVMLVDCDRVLALRQDCAEYRAVAIGGGGNNDVTIDGLRSRDARSNSWPKGDHGDGIHLWTDSKRGPMRNITIRNCVMTDGTGNPIMGISLQNTGGHYTDGVVIENNLFYGKNAQAIRLDAARNGRITNNALVPSCKKQTSLFGGIGPKQVGGIKIAQGEAKVIMTGAVNMAVDGNIFGSLPRAAGVKVGKNLNVTFADLPRVFVNPASVGPSGFTALAGGPGAGLGIK